MRILITGGAGFLGHHICEFFLRNTDAELVSIDRLDTSGNLNRLTDLECWPREGKRVKIVWHDLKAAISSSLARQIGHVDVILHLAASTHVDRSIADPMSFVMDNVVGTANLLEYARTLNHLQVFYYQSTDEIFGPAPAGTAYQEWDRYRSANPYAATKSGAEELCLAYHNTYGVPVIIAHTMNLIGQRQHREKFLPSTIRKIRDGEEVTIHADPTLTHSGSRFYLHARNLAHAILFLLSHAAHGEKYNIVGEREVSNLELAELVSAMMQQPLRFSLVDAHSSRPGHDLRYALDGQKMADLGWTPPVNFEESLRRTVLWSLEHPQWLEG